MGMAHPALSHKVTWMRKAKVTGQDSEGIAAAKTLESSNIWGNKWTSWEQEVGWGEQPHTAILAAHRDVVCSSSMLSSTDRDDSLHKLCLRTAHKPEQRPFFYAPRRFHCWRHRGVRCWRKGQIGEDCFGFHHALILWHSVLCLFLPVLRSEERTVLINYIYKTYGRTRWRHIHYTRTNLI